MMTQGGKVKKFQISAVKDINAIVPGWGIDVDHYHVYKICHVIEKRVHSSIRDRRLKSLFFNDT